MVSFSFQSTCPIVQDTPDKLSSSLPSDYKRVWDGKRPVGGGVNGIFILIMLAVCHGGGGGGGGLAGLKG